MPQTSIQAFPVIEFAFNTCFTNLQEMHVNIKKIKTLKQTHTSRVKAPAIIYPVSFNSIYLTA